MTRSIKNATIQSTMLGPEDHGIPSYMIHLDYGGAGQGFGGHRLGGKFTHEAIFRLLNVVGVECWEALPGKSVRVDSDYSRAYRIGHFLKEEWLDLAELAEELGE